MGVESPNIDSSPRTDYRIATVTTLDSTAAIFTATSRDGVHLECIIRHREEEVSSRKNREFTTRPDAGGDDRLALEKAAVIPIANFKEDRPQVAA